MNKMQKNFSIIYFFVLSLVPVGVPVVALLPSNIYGGPRDISISVVWSPFAAIYFIPIEDWIGRLYYFMTFTACRLPNPSLLTPKDLDTEKIIINRFFTASENINFKAVCAFSYPYISEEHPHASPWNVAIYKEHPIAISDAHV